MRKISARDLARIEDARSTIENKKGELEAFLSEIQGKIDQFVQDAEEAREELYGVLDDLCNQAQEYYDGRSEKWMESDAGSQYQDWINQLESARDSAGEEIVYQIDDNPSFDSFEAVIDAVGDGMIPEAPDQC